MPGANSQSANTSGVAFPLASSGSPSFTQRDPRLHSGQPAAGNPLTVLATGDRFRATPFWGICQRRLFLYERRSENSKTIPAHESAHEDCDEDNTESSDLASDAQAPMQRLQSLSQPEKQGVLDFLRAF